MAKRPWRSHYTRDWATDPFVRGLALDARMVYAELLDIAWDEGGLQQEWITHGTYVAQRIGISRRKFVVLWLEVRDKFVEFSPGIWSNLRLESERTRAENFSEKQANAGKQRHAKPANAEPAHKAPAQPSESQSESHTQSEKKKKQRPAKPAASSEPTPVFQVVEAWRNGWAERFKPASGRAPEPNDADWKQAKNLLAAHDLTETLALVARFLDDTDKFVAERGHMLRDLPSRLARYAKGDGPLFRPGSIATSASFAEAGDKTAEYT